MLLDLLGRLKRILPLAKRVAEDIVSENTEILEEIIPQMFEVMQRVAKFSCSYVRRGRFGRRAAFWTWQMLMIAERTIEGLVYLKDKEMIDELDAELSEVIEDFLRAVDVEALRLAKKRGTYSFHQCGDSSFSV